MQIGPRFSNFFDSRTGPLGPGPVLVRESLPLSLPFPLLFALSGFSCSFSAINSFSFSLKSTLSSSARFGSSFMGLQTGA